MVDVNAKKVDFFTLMKIELGRISMAILFLRGIHKVLLTKIKLSDGH